jgi:putative transposase
MAPPKEKLPRAPRRKSARALTEEEKKKILDVLHEERFVDKAPAAVYAKLLDEGVYLCSIRTMYRILKENNEVRERRDRVSRTEYKKPELLATRPNQVWSWDITKLKGPHKWTSYHLYVILDIFSRKVVGWMISTRESGELAEQLILESCHAEGVVPETLTIHSDRGPAMTSKSVELLLAELGVTKSLSRPNTSNDNAFSESQFSNLKSRPTFPKYFGSIQDARAFCKWFFRWYNEEHYHSGIALMTPSVVHSGQAKNCSRRRQRVLDKAFTNHPTRFVRGRPKTLKVPKEVWINPPNKKEPNEFIATTSAGTIIR